LCFVFGGGGVGGYVVVRYNMMTSNASQLCLLLLSDIMVVCTMHFPSTNYYCTSVVWYNNWLSMMHLICCQVFRPTSYLLSVTKKATLMVHHKVKPCSIGVVFCSLLYIALWYPKYMQVCLSRWYNPIIIQSIPPLYHSFRPSLLLLSISWSIV